MVFQGEQQALLQAGPSAPCSLPPLQQLQVQPGLPMTTAIPAVTNHVPLTVSQQQQPQQALTSGTGQPGQQDASATPFGVASLQVVLLTSCAHAIAAAPLKPASLNVEHRVGNKIHLWLLHHSGLQQFTINGVCPCL